MRASPKARAPRSRKKRHGRLYAATRPFARILRFFGTAFLCYLMQVSVIPLIRIGDVSPNLLLAAGAVYTVAYPSRLRAVWVGVFFGLLTQAVSPSVDMMNMIIYPVLISFSSILFCDKSDARLEAERARNRDARDMNVYLRTFLCVLMISLAYETVNVMYLYLTGITLTETHIRRAAFGVLGTVLLTVPTFVIVRFLLGFEVLPKSTQKEAAGRYIA